jgi:hypothetical protein
MQQKVAKELIIYMLIFVTLALLMHLDLFTEPVSRFSTMLERENFYHPLVYTSIVYIVILFFRLFIKYISVILNKL